MSEEYLTKYIEEIDRFVKIKKVNSDDMEHTLLSGSLYEMDRDNYKKLIIERTILGLNPSLNIRIDDLDLDIVEALYSQSVAINEDLAIERVSIDQNGRSYSEEEYRNEKVFVPKVEIKSLNQRNKSPLEIMTQFKQRMEDEVRGQPQIIGPLSDNLEDYLANLQDESKPLGSYLFMGPTGVGKTLTAKSVAGMMFDGNMIRIDCPEYALPHEIAKLIGSPPGYIGHNDGGYLTGALRQAPKSVVLFDELEKAHPNLHNIILRMLDEGVISDSKGLAVDCSKALIMMTSNAGASVWEEFRKTEEYRRMDPLTKEGRRTDMYLEAARKIFSPEFRGRLDRIIVYNEFDIATATSVAGKVIEEVNKAFGTRHGIDLRWTEEVSKFVAEVSDYERYGGRDMFGTVKSAIKRPLRKMLLEETLVRGDAVKIAYDDNSPSKISFKIKRNGKNVKSDCTAEQ